MHPRLNRVLLCSCLTLLSGCWWGHRQLPTLSIPDAERITALSIDDNLRHADQPRTIDNPTVIAEFMAFINGLSERWQRPRDPLPPAQYRILLEGNYPGDYAPTVLSGQVSVFLGQDWLAATESWEHSGATRMLSLSTDENEIRT